jgi:hypothetical protein
MVRTELMERILEDHSIGGTISGFGGDLDSGPGIADDPLKR